MVCDAERRVFVKKEKILTIPNIITSLRIVGTIVLIFIEPLTLPFYIAYTLTGVTDVLDGFIARMTGTATSFGAKLDSLSDLLFYTVLLLKILPTLRATLPDGIWLAVAAIIVIRLASYVVAAIKYRRFASVHTYMNKMTGLMIFAVPYAICTPYGVGFSIAVCVVAGMASTEELFLHLTAKEYNSERKSLIIKR